MRLLLDTTYLLPAIGISVKGVPADGITRLIHEGHELHASEIGIFELSAKGAKYVVAGTLTPERVSRGIRAIVHDGTITTIPFHESSLLLMAFKIRSMLDDFIDCLILSSAIGYCDRLVTEDNDILKLRRDEKFEALYARANPRFLVQTLAETT